MAQYDQATQARMDAARRQSDAMRMQYGQANLAEQKRMGQYGGGLDAQRMAQQTALSQQEMNRSQDLWRTNLSQAQQMQAGQQAMLQAPRQTGGAAIQAGTRTYYPPQQGWTQNQQQYQQPSPWGQQNYGGGGGWQQQYQMQPQQYSPWTQQYGGYGGGGYMGYQQNQWQPPMQQSFGGYGGGYGGYNPYASFWGY